MTVSGVTVIIPTTGLKERRESLFRAIGTIQQQTYHPIQLIVVLNGTSYDKDIYNDLISNSKISFLYIKKANVANARFEGLKFVSTPYFCFLDDDDYYTSDSIEKKIRQFESNRNMDVVIGNGYYQNKQNKEIVLKDIKKLNKNPLREIIKYNWLLSPAALFKSKIITANYFDSNLKYFEWTYLAYLIASRCRLKFINDMTYFVNNTENSVSKSEAYILSQPELYERLREYEFPTDIKKKIKKEKLCYHSISSYYLKSGDLKNAWKWHLKSINHPFGVKFLPYTRKLFYYSK